MNRTISFLISVAVLAACGPNEASIYEEGDKDVGQSVGKELNIATSEFYPAPFASTSLSGITPAAPRTSTFSYHATGATTPSDRFRFITLSGLPINRPLEISVDSVPDGATDPVISVVDAQLAVLGSDDDSGPGSNALLRSTFTNSAAAPFGLLVREYGKKAGTFRVTIKDLSVPTTGAGGGSGGSDTVLNAAEGLTQSAMLGRLSMPARKTVAYRSPPNLRAYSVYLSAGQKLDVTVASASGDAYAFLFGPAPAYALLTKDDDSGGNRNSHFTYTATQAGTFYVAFRDYNLREATFELAVQSGVPLPVVPSAPTSLSATAASAASTVRLAYEVPYSTEFTMVLECRAEDQLNARQFTWSVNYNLDYSSSQRMTSRGIANLSSGRHAFKLQCRNASGWSAWSGYSNSVELTGGGTGSNVPTAPSGVIVDRFEPGTGTVVLPSLIIRFIPGTSSASQVTECEGEDTQTSRTYSWAQAYYASSSMVRASDVATGDHAFRVRCRNSYGFGPWSATSAVYRVGVLTLPRAPTTPAATFYSFDPGTVRLSFDVSDYWSASISGCKAQDMNTQNIVTLNASATNYLTLAASVGVHAYRVACRNVNGWGPWSATSNSVTVQ